MPTNKGILPKRICQNLGLMNQCGFSDNCLYLHLRDTDNPQPNAESLIPAKATFTETRCTCSFLKHTFNTFTKFASRYLRNITFKSDAIEPRFLWSLQCLLSITSQRCFSLSTLYVLLEQIDVGWTKRTNISKDDFLAFVADFSQKFDLGTIVDNENVGEVIHLVNSQIVWNLLSIEASKCDFVNELKCDFDETSIDVSDVVINSAIDDQQSSWNSPEDKHRVIFHLRRTVSSDGTYDYRERWVKDDWILLYQFDLKSADNRPILRRLVQAPDIPFCAGESTLDFAADLNLDLFKHGYLFAVHGTMSNVGGRRVFEITNGYRTIVSEIFDRPIISAGIISTPFTSFMTFPLFSHKGKEYPRPNVTVSADMLTFEVVAGCVDHVFVQFMPLRDCSLTFGLRLNPCLQGGHRESDSYGTRLFTRSVRLRDMVSGIGLNDGDFVHRNMNDFPYAMTWDPVRYSHVRVLPPTQYALSMVGYFGEHPMTMMCINSSDLIAPYNTTLETHAGERFNDFSKRRTESSSSTLGSVLSTTNTRYFVQTMTVKYSQNEHVHKMQVCIGHDFMQLELPPPVVIETGFLPRKFIPFIFVSKLFRRNRIPPPIHEPQLDKVAVTRCDVILGLKYVDMTTILNRLEMRFTGRPGTILETEEDSDVLEELEDPMIVDPKFKRMIMNGTMSQGNTPSSSPPPLIPPSDSSTTLSIPSEDGRYPPGLTPISSPEPSRLFAVESVPSFSAFASQETFNIEAKDIGQEELFSFNKK
ncbi:hypothetical protein PCE1_004745 [Barthelona sp. PCE]